MKTIIAAAILAIGLTAGAFGDRARAETVWHYPYKGVPYVTETTLAVSDDRTRHRHVAYSSSRRPAGEKPSQMRAYC